MLCLTALGERGLTREQQGPVSSMGSVGSRLSQQCIRLFIYFKEETDGENKGDSFLLVRMRTLGWSDSSHTNAMVSSFVYSLCQPSWEGCSRAWGVLQ